MGKVGIVYQWTNIENQKWYIGSHYGYLDDGYIGSGIVFKAAYEKNKNKMMRSILYIGDSFRMAEQFYLLCLDAAKDRQSYNMKNASIGGDVSHCFTEESRKKMSDGSKKRVVVHSEMTKNKISKSLSGRKLSDDLRKKYSEIKLGEKNNFFGKKHTEESRAKISASKKGKKMPKEVMDKLHDRNKIPVMCNDNGLVFCSVKEAAMYFDKSESHLSNMLSGRVKNTLNIQKHA